MLAGKLRRLSVLLLAGGFVFLLLSFLPQPAGEQEPATIQIERPALVITEVSLEKPPIDGAALFQAKGCPACHRHDALSNTGISTEIGPDLTGYQPDPDFVRAWLRDPAAIRPDTAMPNLNLSEDEIEALVAFLEE